MKMHFRSEFFRFCLLVAAWLLAYKMADVFAFFRTYSSLWFLPAGMTLAIVLTAPRWLKVAPLVANLLLAIPAFCAALGVDFTNSRDPILHALRLYAIYGGLGALLNYIIRPSKPPITLTDYQWVLGLSLLAASLAAITGVSLHAAVGNMPWAVGWDIVFPWAVGDAIGVIIVPPVVVPLLMRLFRERSEGTPYPSPLSFVVQVLLISATLIIGMLVPRFHPDLGSLWYLILIPPIFFALRGGVTEAASSVFLTNLLTPPAAFWLNYHGERLPLQLLLLISSVVGLSIGAAISDRGRAYRRLLQNEAELEQLVEQRTAELEQAYELQRHLVRSIGHDLRQPMQAMNFMLDGLLLAPASAEFAAAIGQIRNLGEVATNLLSSVLRYARADTGMAVSAVAAFPVQRLFESLLQVYGSRADEKGVRLIAHATDVVVVSDESLVLEALSNFVDNAVRISGEGMTVGLLARRVDNQLSLIVRDEISGEGAPGAAGFGMGIVDQIAGLIGARVAHVPNAAMLVFDGGTEVRA